MIYKTPITYAVKHNDLKIRSYSRSGGVFTAFSDLVLGQGGIVYGCVLSSEMKAQHYRATTQSERDLMRGSKYVESKLGKTYKTVKKDLEDGKYVLFSGTSCQVAGLRSFLRKDYPNLLLIDILCHGVPSPVAWERYLKWQEKKHGKCIRVDFRNKADYGWSDHVESLWFKNGRQVNSRIYTALFYSHLILRPSCYSCHFKTVIHPGDVTIADYWEIDRALPGFNDNKGVSLVMINNERGKDVFKSVMKDLIYEKTEFEESTRPSMFNSAQMPQNREEFWMDFSKRGFDYLVFKYLNSSLRATYVRQCKKKIKSILKTFVRND